MAVDVNNAEELNMSSFSLVNVRSLPFVPQGRTSSLNLE